MLLYHNVAGCSVHPRVQICQPCGHPVVEEGVLFRCPKNWLQLRFQSPVWAMSFCLGVSRLLIYKMEGGGYPKFLPAHNSLLYNTQLVKTYIRSPKLTWFIFSHFAFIVPKVLYSWEMQELKWHKVFFSPLSNVPAFILGPPTDIEPTFYFPLFYHEHKMWSPSGNGLYYRLYAWHVCG